MQKIILWITVLHLSLHAIVSVEPVEPGEGTGFSGEVDAAFKESGGNIERKDYSGGIKVQYDYPGRADFIVGNSLYAESEGEAIENNSFLHFRHLESIREGIVWEVYAQSETNEFINLTLRELAGAGPRLRFFSSEKMKFFFGLGAYASAERYSRTASEESEEYKTRGNAYISYKQKKSEQFEATSTLTMP